MTRNLEATVILACPTKEDAKELISKFNAAYPDLVERLTCEDPTTPSSD